MAPSSQGLGICVHLRLSAVQLRNLGSMAASNHDLLVLRIERWLEQCPGGVWFAREVYGVLPARDKFRRDDLVTLHVAEGNRPAQGEPVIARGSRAHEFAVAENPFAAPEHR